MHVGGGSTFGDRQREEEEFEHTRDRQSKARRTLRTTGSALPG